MLFFPEKHGAYNDDGRRKNFYIFSSRVDICAALSENLRMAGISSVESIDHHLFEHPLSIPGNANGVIVDIADSNRVEQIMLTIHSQVPRDAWCCLIGDSDSISLAQTFIKNNIHYFNIHTQQDSLVQTAVTGAQLSHFRQPVSVSVLGCKGGVGTTTVGFQLVSEIVRTRHLPSLMVQGKFGSRDLDLVSGKKMIQEVTPVAKQLDLMSSQSELLPDLSQPDLQKYNFVVFEQAINTADKELQRNLVEQSRCMVLVLDRSMSSVRVARSMIENMEILKRSHSTPRRLFLCINDTRPVTINSLTRDDMQGLLDYHIDVVLPYSKETKMDNLNLRSLFRNKTPLEELTRKVLGGEVNKKISSIRNRFKLNMKVS